MEPVVEWDVVVICGINTDYLIRDRGNLLVWESGEEWIPELAVGRVDATGAGDAFAGGLAVALAERQPLPDAARLASGVAALATTALGAQTALPHRRALHAFLERATSAHSH